MEGWAQQRSGRAAFGTEFSPDKGYFGLNQVRQELGVRNVQPALTRNVFTTGERPFDRPTLVDQAKGYTTKAPPLMVAGESSEVSDG